MHVVGSAAGDLATSLKGVGMSGREAGSWARGSVAPASAHGAPCTPAHRWAEPDARRWHLVRMPGGHLGTLSKNKITHELI